MAANNLIDLLHHIIRQPIKLGQYEYQTLIFLYAAHCLFLMQQPGYEKAIAEWVQTDSHGTWTDLKFELLEVLETENVTVSDSLRHLNNKSAQLSAVIQKAESPRALFKPSFSAYMEAEKSMKETEAMYLNRDSAEVIGKIEMQVCHRPTTFRGTAEKNGFFPIVPRHGEMYRKTKACKQIIRA